MDNGFEILDINSLRRRNEPWVKKIFGDISKRSAAQQIAIGGVSGWFVGFLFVKVTKAAVCSLGMSVLLVQIAQHQGYIKINYKGIQSDINRTAERINRQANRQYPSVVENLKRFIQKNMCLAGGFAGGFLIGIAF